MIILMTITHVAYIG